LLSNIISYNYLRLLDHIVVRQDLHPFQFHRKKSRSGKWMPLVIPEPKKRTALLRRLKMEFRSHRSQPVQRLVARINTMLRGWVNYFAIGNSSRCFSFIRQWVERKMRRHLARARQRQGFGWKRWSREWLYERLGLFNDYRVKYVKSQLKASPA
ncbi:MAG: hypothetical protein GY847_28130, partial [Proteobacteria bacterium]|nr:hypothetical protein [Pseudomonadota bacterium]